MKIFQQAGSFELNAVEYPGVFRGATRDDI